LLIRVLSHGVVFDPSADPGDISVSQVEAAQSPAFLVVLLDHPQAADGEKLLAPQIQLAGGHELFLGLELKVLRQRLAQLGGFLGCALLEDLLFVRADLLDLLEEPIALFRQEDLFAAKLLTRQIAERLVPAEDFVNEGHCVSYATRASTYSLSLLGRGI